MKRDYARLIASLSEDPMQGTPLGMGCYKHRLAISSKSKGKSGGARVITYIAIKDNVVYLLSMYDKSEQESISRKDLLALRAMIP